MKAGYKFRFYGVAAVLGLSLLYGAMTYVQEKNTVHHTAFVQASFQGNYLYPRVKKSINEGKFEIDRDFLRAFQSEVMALLYAEFDESSLWARRSFDFRPVLGTPGLFKVDLFLKSSEESKKKLSAVMARLHSVYGQPSAEIPSDIPSFDVLKYFAMPILRSNIRFGIVSDFPTPRGSGPWTAFIDTVFVTLFLLSLLFAAGFFVRRK